MSNNSKTDERISVVVYYGISDELKLAAAFSNGLLDYFQDG
jgi:hypothetical protein